MSFEEAQKAGILSGKAVTKGKRRGRKKGDPKNSLDGKRSELIGRNTEGLAEKKLEEMGAKLVENVGKGMKVIRGVNGKVLRAVPQKKVNGDIRAFLPPYGRGIIAEVKHRNHSSGNLHFSDLEKHQVEGLDKANKIGIVTLLIWVVSPSEIYVMRWPIKDFKNGSGLKKETAKKISILNFDLLS